MKKVFFFLIGFSLLQESCSDDGWKVVSTDDYTIAFPITPQDTAVFDDSLPGIRLFVQMDERSIDSNRYYSFTQYTMKDSLSSLDEYHERLFHSDVQIFAWSINGTLADSVGKPVQAGQVTGYEYRVLLDANAGIARIRKFAQFKHLYTLMVLTDNKHIANLQADKFLNSFQMKKKNLPKRDSKYILDSLIKEMKKESDSINHRST
jgi:hypothetical protein